MEQAPRKEKPDTVFSPLENPAGLAYNTITRRCILGSVKRDEMEGQRTNPKKGAGSGVGRTSSVAADEGPKTNQSTPEGKSIVDELPSKKSPEGKSESRNQRDRE